MIKSYYFKKFIYIYYFTKSKSVHNTKMIVFCIFVTFKIRETYLFYFSKAFVVLFFFKLKIFQKQTFFSYMYLLLQTAFSFLIKVWQKCCICFEEIPRLILHIETLNMNFREKCRKDYMTDMLLKIYKFEVEFIALNIKMTNVDIIYF